MDGRECVLVELGEDPLGDAAEEQYGNVVLDVFRDERLAVPRLKSRVEPPGDLQPQVLGAART